MCAVIQLCIFASLRYLPSGNQNSKVLAKVVGSVASVTIHHKVQKRAATPRLARLPPLRPRAKMSPSCLCPDNVLKKYQNKWKTSVRSCML